MEANVGRSKASRVLLGAVLVALGTLPVIQRLSALFEDAAQRGWPLLVFGLSLLAIWLILAGASFVAGAVKFAHLMLVSPWPLIVALVGVVLVWRALARGNGPRAMARMPHGA